MGPFFDNRAEIIWEVLARERLVNISIRPSANSTKMKRVARPETCVCFRMTRLMNNQINSRKRATSQKEEEAMTSLLWQLWKVYHNWVVYRKIQMHSFLKAESLGVARCRKSWNTFKGYDALSTLRQASIREKKGPSLGKNKCQSSSSAKSLRYEIRGQVPWRDWKTAAMCPKQGLESCPKYTSSKKNTRLHSSFPRRNGYSRLRQKKEPEER